MKKLLFVIVIVTLPLIAFFQYKEYRRFNPPTAYEYLVSSEIDVNYHDYSMVDEYYNKSVEVGAFARSKWRNEGIDVLYPDQEVQAEVNAAAHYNQMLSRIRNIEAKLIKSEGYKKDGFSNEEVQMIESGIPQDLVRYVSDGGMMELTLGDRGQGVYLLQKKLITKGYDHNLDGVFGLDTQSAIRNFQSDNDLYTSGILDKITFVSLFLNN